ncbi:carbohydrate kinase family protein [Alicyclobacillus tolerans]|uniref:carbohydrate kinase family protein n=1 Tax=Alicyclobacillus tolerans TaxID=90970 RepID=UPI001F1BA3A3|nr:carbohydrate kinase family protein [Alicyclobacillus tolerans]MCF8566705.1 carbohydrate kinase family protein [Alicyclobacillus tolerans]
MERGSPKVLFAGHISLDIIPDLSQVTGGFEVFRPGGLVLVDGVRFTTGGAVLNTGLALHRLGSSVRLLIHIGADPYGRILRELVKSALHSRTAAHAEKPRSDVVVLEREGEQTSFTFVFSPKDTDRMFVSCPGTNSRFRLDDIEDEFLQGIELFHFGYPPLLQHVYLDGGESLARMLKGLQRRGIVTSLDMCMPDLQGASGQVDWRSFLSRVLPYVDVFMPSVEELFFMLRPRTFLCESQFAVGLPAGQKLWEADLAEMAQTLVDMGTRIAGIKLGDQGLYVRTGEVQHPGDASEASGTDPASGVGDAAHSRRPSWWQGLTAEKWNHRELYIPCFQAQVAGTTGAGDSTIAGFLSGLLHGLAPEECMTHAVAVGACSVEQMDATSGIPTWEQVQGRLQKGWASLPPMVALSNWAARDSLHYGPRDQK